MQYYEFVHNLGPLESVDHRTFQADKGFSQAVCDFILALALVHGDIMNLFLAHTLLVEARPQQPLKETPPWALWGGVVLHVLRIQATVIHELFSLIRANKQVLTDQGLNIVLKRMPIAARKRWEAIVAAAMRQRSNDPFARALAIIRNKVGSHYDIKEIGRAFSHLPSSEDPVLFMSRGSMLGASRFYFADAVADVLLLQSNTTNDAKRVLLDPSELLEGVAATLFTVVTHFVVARGFDCKVLEPRA
jgi:hypothetical protein